MSFPALSVAIPFDNFIKSISFAEQLVSLDQNQFDKAMPKAKKAGDKVTEIRDVADPMYVSKWLLSFLTNRNSNVVTDNDFPKITKKIRDDVIFKGGDLPFRRSGLLMTMKVMLQLNLEKEFNRDVANFIYKIIQIHLGSKMCELWLRYDYRTINAGLAMQMLAKIGRKVDKLSTKWETLIDKRHCESLYIAVTSYAKETIIKVRDSVNDQFSNLCLEDRYAALLTPLDDMDFESDTIHKIPSLTKYLETRLEAAKVPSSTSLFEPKEISRHRMSDFPSFKLVDVRNQDELCLLLADIENWVRENINKCATIDVVRLRDLAVNYGIAAKIHYKGDPLGGSRMILTILQIIRKLDELATEDYSLLLEHHSGINPKIIEDLLLPSRDQLEVSLDLETYFEQRNSEAKFPALNSENVVSQQSFSARFAESNPNMKALRQTILAAEEKCIEEKKAQVNRGREILQRWREQSQYLSHEFTKYWDTYQFRSEHDPECKLCILAQKCSRYKCRIYERALRQEEHCQYAVVFELLIPTEISCLRDVLQFACDEFFFNKAVTKLSVKGEWINYDQISSYRKEIYRRVHLGSTWLLYLKSHYPKKLHPDSYDCEFIVNCGYNCVYYGPKNIELSNNIEKQSVKGFCTFQVESNSPYQSLQWTLSSTDHKQNEVLASQNECPIELTLSEYVTFGSLRSDGHRLQIRNIYRALATESLSFEKESVVALVLQALWQTGPKACDKPYIRESHEDLCDEVFASEMLELLTKYMSLQQDNWKHPLKIMVTILLATRILELNENETIVEKTVNLLLYSRSICHDWMERIQLAKSQCDCKEMIQFQNLRANMVDVGICCALTFYGSPKLKAFPQLWQSTTTIPALSYWLKATVSVNNNFALNMAEKRGFSNFRRTFLREMRIIGIRSETLLLDQITKGFSTDMNQFVTNQWQGVRNGMFKQWKSFPNVQQVVHTELMALENEQKNHIQIDVILGTFLVNGLPVSGLPEVITNHKSFKRLFGATSFEVQPTKNGTFCTSFKYNDCSYHFKMEAQELIITEERSNGDVFELIPNEIFDKDIPFILQREYSHWWHRNRQSIEFRPVKFNVDNFANSDQIQFELDLNTRFLTELKTSRKVIDRLSDSFFKISEHLRRLESEKYIITIMDGVDKVSIELPRMRLQFKLDESNEIMSHEYVGMQISRDQKFGTFIGLHNGLLLEHKDNGEKLIIMPHGKIETKCSSKGHADVWITTNNLREPPFFIYDIDNRCQQFRARGSCSAWFYLAHLHAVTAHPLPDPFTGMRGTEKALQILQSAFCWSSEPYDNESITTLCRIKKLSPNRSYHPTHQCTMQTVQFPNNLPTTSSHEAYAIVVNRLIQDSERLEFLHFKDTSIDSETHLQSNKFLNERSYRRYVCYDPNVTVNHNFIEDPGDSNDGDCSSEEENNDSRNDSDSIQSTTIDQIEYESDIERHNRSRLDYDTKKIRILAALAHDHQFHVPSNCANRLSRLLFSKENLNGLTDNITGYDLMTDMDCDLRDIWIELYDIACNESFDDVKFTLALTLLALHGNDLFDLLTLQVVAANPSIFRTIELPTVQLYTKLMEDYFDKSKVSEIILSCSMSRDTYLSLFEDQLTRTPVPYKESLTLKLSLEWNQKIRSECKTITSLIEKQWPCIECDLSKITTPYIYIDKVIEILDPLLKMWYENRQLKLFVEQVNKAMLQLTHQSTELDSLKVFTYDVSSEDSCTKYKIDFTDKITKNFSNGVLPSEKKSATRLFEEGHYNEEQDVNHWWQRIKELSIPIEESYLDAANIYPRLAPTLILPQMISSKNENQRNMIGALGVLFSLDQRANRIKKLEQQQPQMEVALRREKEEIPFSNWAPCTYPQWLLFEIEMNLTIRRIQIEVAERMISPPGDIHSVMQLNMGEGKTAVIVPLLCAVLSNEEHVCQVTVLKSLFKSNLKALRQFLGGMLNHRIYTFPCRRDMTIGKKEAELILQSYEECMDLKGVIMTLPEYRLSLQLKLYETARKQEFKTSSVLLEIHRWLNKNVRNVLDECDAILNAKYQLIYTVGEQLPLNGGELRWTIIQNILKIVPSNLKILWKKYGNEKIEFDHQFYSEEGKQRFCPCRILHPSVYNELATNIANDFIDEKTRISFPKLKSSQKRLVRAVIANRNVDARTYDSCMNIFEENPVYKDVILVLSGLLKFEVLHLVMKKRWRVNYGINPNGRRKMAVPFIAKDVCAENTEFGHPDVAICFTYLSYYYSGLTDAQLLNCFDILDKLSNSDEKYKEWFAGVPNQNIPRSIRTYSGINLSDANQRVTLFTLLRYNMNVIDFWLSNMVLPREAKQFDGKMMCTAWELVSEELTNVVTGFSGTNDTKLLLPEPICQNDLDELEDTNENVRETIIQEDNDNYDNLHSNISGIEILKKLVEKEIPVLLDSGALMLELNNEEVATEWLKLVATDEFDAAVYFNDKNLLMVVDRQNCQREFDVSPYFNRLDRCIVYLDDAHTRGTDLKFPSGIKACVTLSGGITRDKTVQACMRMRLLGQGHIICFWASEEADNGIRELCEKGKTDPIFTEDVFNWICHNSRAFENDGLVHWATAAYNYSQKLAAYRYTPKDATDDDMKKLSNCCTDKEIIKLCDLYGGRKQLSIVNIFKKRYSRLVSKYKNESDIKSFLKANSDFVVKRLQEYVPHLKRFSQTLEDEQEKELEYELEEEREVQRPGKAHALVPVLNKRIEEFLRYGTRNRKFLNELIEKQHIMYLGKALQNTNLWSTLNKAERKWGNEIYVTTDFVNVVQAQFDKSDEFLRPVWWLVSANSTERTPKQVVLLMSPFEVNNFLPIFRENPSTTLRMYSPRLTADSNVNTMMNCKALQLPFDSDASDIDGLVESQLSVFAGTIYFENKLQMDNYCTFLGIIPSPFAREYQKAFDKGQISLNGFVRPDFRNICEKIKNGCPFKKNPDELVRGIVERRHGFLPKNSHVSKIVIEGTIAGIKFGNQ